MRDRDRLRRWVQHYEERFDYHHGHDEHHHGHRHGRGRGRYAEEDRVDRLQRLEAHRRDVEEYLADLSEKIKRLQEDEVTATAAPKASPGPS